MHIGASTHAELFRCSKTIGSLVEHHRLNHGLIITGIVYGDLLLVPWAVGGSWAVRLSEILVSAVDCERQALPAPQALVATRARLLRLST